MICSLLCFMEKEGGLSSISCNLIYFVHLRKILRYPKKYSSAGLKKNYTVIPLLTPPPQGKLRGGLLEVISVLRKN